MNRLSIFIATLILNLTFSKGWAEDFHIYVSPLGNDTCQGTVLSPVASYQQALRLAREKRRTGWNEGAIIIDYPDTPEHFLLTEPIRIRPEDSGTPETPLIITGNSSIEGSELSGGMPITRWKRQGKLLVADVPEWNGYPIDFRQFYSPIKAVRAQDVPVGGDSEQDEYEQMSRILSLDKTRRILYVPATPTIRKIARQGVGHTEMVLHTMWCINNLRIKSISIEGDSAAVRFHEPEADVFWEHPWPLPFTGQHASPFYLTNHFALLDEPGEWFHDIGSHKLYYYPRNAEEADWMLHPNSNRELIPYVPALENILIIEGTPERPVHDVVIRQLSFSGTTWMRPSTHGHVPLQAGMYLIEGYKVRPSIVRPDRNHKLDNQAFCGRPAAAVRVHHAQRITFDQCSFSQTASTSIDFEEGTRDCIVANCTFYNIGGAAIVAGSFSPESFEGHLPYSPQDPRQLCRGLIVANNWIENTGLEDWGTPAISAGWVTDALIACNTIRNVPYTGISLGWGWTQSLNSMSGNEVYRNRITRYARHMYDVAGIYTLSAQPKTYITENVIDSICNPSYVHDPNHWFYLYTDEGSSFITVQDNWCPSEKFLQNANGPGNTWQNNGPTVADSILHNAGCKHRLWEGSDPIPSMSLDDIKRIRPLLQTRKPKK